MTTVTDLAAAHEELAHVTRKALATAAPEEAVDWDLVVRSGWVGLEAPSSVDGADATFAEVAVVLREWGRAAALGPYPSVTLAVAALVGTGLDRPLSRAIDGHSTPIVVLSAAGDGPSQLELGADGDATLTGSTTFVPDADRADLLLVPARTPDGEIVLVTVDPNATGVSIRTKPVVDATRDLADISLDGVHVTRGQVARWGSDGGTAIDRLRDRAALSIACDSVGLADAMLDATVTYAGVREQFGRKIGSFQAVKHACADMLVQVSVARRLVQAAIDAVVSDDPAAPIAVSKAASFADEAAVSVCGKAVQLHGGIGYTWESGLHVYLKRATLNRSLYGSPAWHRARIAERYRDAEPPNPIANPRRAAATGTPTPSVALGTPAPSAE
ncbi:acyl-CoA dehydrogenase [Gordonia sp. CPCC 206044]